MVPPEDALSTDKGANAGTRDHVDSIDKHEHHNSLTNENREKVDKIGEIEDDEDHTPLSEGIVAQQEMPWKDWVLQTLQTKDNEDDDDLILDIVANLYPLVADIQASRTYDGTSSSEGEHQGDTSFRKGKQKYTRRSFMKPTNASIMKKRKKAAAAAASLRRTSSVNRKGEGKEANIIPVRLIRYDTNVSTIRPPPLVRAPTYSTGNPQSHRRESWIESVEPPVAGSEAALQQQREQNSPSIAEQRDREQNARDKSEAGELREPAHAPAMQVGKVDASAVDTTTQANVQETKAKTPDNIEAKEAELEASHLATIVKYKGAEKALNARDEKIRQLKKDLGDQKTLNDVTLHIFQTEIEEEKAKNEDLEKSFEQSKERTKSLERQIAEKEFEKQKMMEELECLKQRASTTTDNEQIQQYEIAILGLEELSKEQAELIEGLEDQLEEARTVECQLEEATHQCTIANSRIKVLEWKLSKIIRQVPYATVYATDEEHKAALQQNLEQAVEAKELLEQKESGWLEEIARLEEQYKDVSAKLNARENTASYLTKLEKENEELEAKKREIEEAMRTHKEWNMDSQAASNAAVERYIFSIAELQDDLECIDHELENNDKEALGVHDTLLDKMEDCSPTRMTQLRVTIRKLIDRYTASLEDTNHFVDSYRAQITDLKANIQAYEKPAPTLNSEDQQEWMSMFSDERRKFKKLKAAYDVLKIRADEIFRDRPELQRRVADLQAQLSASLKNGKSLTTELDKYKEKAAQWESEHKLIETMCETNRLGYETHLASHVEEMQAIIKEYYRHMPQDDPDWWKVEGLRMIVLRLEKQLKDLGDRLETVGVERQIAYRELDVYIKENEDLLEKNRELKLELNTLPSPPGPSVGRYCGDPGESFTPFTPMLDRDFEVSWFQTQEELEMRRNAMDKFREEQRRAREAEDRKLEVEERIRKWKMGPHYPPEKRTWKQEINKTKWDRWDGKTWKSNAAREEDLQLLEESNMKQ